DVVPSESYKWQHIEKTCLETARLFGFKEIRTPVFEHTELFERGVGDTTDVVQKEMYTFNDKGGRSLTLRPELTASAVRASVERGLIYEALPVKACYIGGCYRSEKPQAGRLREFHQFGVELYGAATPAADAEVISLGASVLRELGLKNISLEINSIGCPTCRAKYNEALREYYSAHIDSICDTCKGRLERNPMRLLDCKAECCREIAANAPRMLDYICEECTEHFASVKQYLDSMGIEYTVNPSIVRGLDYYTRTVFEFISGDIGAQAAVGGGGRYDGLFRQMGGPDTPAVGFAMGLERIKMVLEAQEAEFPEDEKSMIYLAPMGQAAVAKCMEICSKLRAEGFSAETDLNGRSVKAQMKYADKMGFNFSCVIGDSEIESGSVKIKNMKTGEQIETTLEDGILNTLYDIGISQTLSNLQDTMDSLESIGELSALLGGEE
ncbi:MAG: histidine--tRNA ligase, partial [Clostridia bacterium]|nr:histidine--tRNA ligase [Clostridia bacterium]